MRVCLLNWYANRNGGSDVYTEDLAVGLADRGHRVTVVCHDARPKLRGPARCPIPPERLCPLADGVAVRPSAPVGRL